MPRVLVIDDSPTLRRLIVKGLKDAGLAHLQFVEAGDGLEGLEALAKRDFDLIVSDVNMPRLDGVELVRALRDPRELARLEIEGRERIAQTGRDIPIVLVATAGSLGRVEEGLAAGATDYLKKPFTPAEIAEKAAALLR